MRILSSDMDRSVTALDMRKPRAVAATVAMRALMPVARLIPASRLSRRLQMTTGAPGCIMRGPITLPSRAAVAGSVAGASLRSAHCRALASCCTSTGLLQAGVSRGTGST